jgi:RNA polymerase sigma factor (sigma-70 family)
MSAPMVPAESELPRSYSMAIPEQLLARVAAGDRDAMRQCIDAYGPLVWAIAFRILRNEAEAEDAVQDAFIALWKNADRFDPARATEKVFVAMIARRRIIDRRRSLARAPRLGTEEELNAQASSDHLRLERASEAREAAEALLGLPEDRLKVIRLAVFDGLTHDEIAATTGIPLGTVKSHVKRGLATVRDVLLGKRAKEGRAS